MTVIVIDPETLGMFCHWVIFGFKENKCMVLNHVATPQ